MIFGILLIYFHILGLKRSRRAQRNDADVVVANDVARAEIEATERTGGQVAAGSMDLLLALKMLV